MKHSLKILIRISVEIMEFPERKRFSWRLKITRDKVLLNTVFDHVYEHLCLASLLAIHFGFSSSDTVGGGGKHVPLKAVLARLPAPLAPARSWDHQLGEHGSTTQCHTKCAATRTPTNETLVLLWFLQNAFASRRKAPGSGIKELKDSLSLLHFQAWCSLQPCVFTMQSGVELKLKVLYPYFSILFVPSPVLTEGWCETQPFSSLQAVSLLTSES